MFQKTPTNEESSVIIRDVRDFQILKHELDKLKIPVQISCLDEIKAEQHDHNRLVTEKATTRNWKWSPMKIKWKDKASWWLKISVFHEEKNTYFKT